MIKPRVIRLTPAQVSAIQVEQPEDHRMGDYGDDAMDRGMMILGWGMDYATGRLMLPVDPEDQKLVADALVLLINSNDAIAENRNNSNEGRGAARRAVRALTALRIWEHAHDG